MSNGEKSGIVTAVFGILYTILSFNIDRATVGNPNEPIIFPLILGILLIVLGFGLYWGEHKKKVALGDKAEGKKKFELTYQIKMIGYICIISVLYGFLFEKLGYVISTTLFMGALLFAFNGKKKWHVNIIVALVFSISIYYSFSSLLSVPLPKMIFFNI